MINQATVGPMSQQSLPSQALTNLRAGQLSDLIVSELHGRFYEQNYRANLFSIGHAAPVALSANTITLVAATTPILGIWNPAASPVNVVMLQAALQDFINNVTSVAPGAFVWAYSANNPVISTGLTPISRKTQAGIGSQVKGFAGATALTGLTNNLTILEAADFPIASGLLTTTVAASTPTPSVGGVQNFDGSLIIPPGGVLALLNTISSVTHSVFGRLLWEEVPV